MSESRRQWTHTRQRQCLTSARIFGNSTDRFITCSIYLPQCTVFGPGGPPDLQQSAKQLFHFPAAFSRTVDATVLWGRQHHTTTTTTSTTSRKSSNSRSTAQLQLHHPASENDPLRRGHQDECHADPSQVVRRRIPHRVVVTQRRKLPPVCSEKAVGTMRKGSENAMGAIRRGGEKAVGHTRKVSANAVEHTRSVQGLRSRLSAGVVGGGGGGVVWGKGGSQTHSSLCSLLSSPLLSPLSFLLFSLSPTGAGEGGRFVI